MHDDFLEPGGSLPGERRTVFDERPDVVGCGGVSRRAERPSQRKHGNDPMARAKPTGRKSSKTPAKQTRPSDTALTVSLAPFLVGGTDLQFREFVADLFAAAAGMQSLRRALAKSVGLSAAEFSVLLATWYLQRQEPVGITAIARHLHVASAHVTAEVGNLVSAGLIKKSQDFEGHAGRHPGAEPARGGGSCRAGAAAAPHQRPAVFGQHRKRHQCGGKVSQTCGG